MEYSCKLKWLHLLSVLLFIALLSGQAFCEETQPKPEVPAKSSPADPVARVNGVVITHGELEKASRVIIAQNQTGKQLTENDIIEELISTELLYQAGNKLVIKDLDKQVGERIANYKAKYPNNAAYEDSLKSAGLTPKELEKLTRKDIVIKNLVEKEIAPKINISESEARKYYDENIDRFKRVDKKEAGVAKFDDVKKGIQEYLKKAQIQKSLAGYIARLRENAKIEKLPYGRTLNNTL